MNMERFSYLEKMRKSFKDTSPIRQLYTNNTRGYWSVGSHSIAWMLLYYTEILDS